MPNYPKVLIACPTSVVKDYAFMRWYTNVQMIIECYPGEVDIFISDNSPTMDYYHYLDSFTDINVGKIHPRGRHSNELLADSHNQCRQFAIDGLYNYLFHIESDVIPPWHSLNTLVAYDLPVVSGVYQSGIAEQRFPMLAQMQPLNGKYELIFSKPEEAVWHIDGTLKPFHASGLGCTLISRDVFSQIAFRHDDKQRMVHPDTLFYEDLRQLLQIRNYVDTAVFCQHHNQDWALNINMHVK